MARRPHDAGASAVEYALLIAGIAAVVVLAVFTLGGAVTGLFTETKDCYAAGASSTC